MNSEMTLKLWALDRTPLPDLVPDGVKRAEKPVALVC